MIVGTQFSLGSTLHNDYVWKQWYMIKWILLAWWITDKYVMTMFFMKLLHLKGRMSPIVAR